ncbi:phosphoribosylaminoimidazolesuccinocarboxamide synthase [uncultured Desulfovibrio sp.]|uniref:Phosphoribosylaminoimidazole-succinocarboxamide synthase n=1 Tax=Candidatus Desulfovibrio intestinavium TaxID=2838534 RepID=A0A9D2HLT2_9BACT|nr:phosphoribosylaminoimidazolesuccinocarboxamide synthase [uncultured Desulfovibrio sp.]HJA79311.1 phosphoribosylaminoimidazolesuccinocarboxamide synthase [Candidatus Desulfovibrio intestinavium]
MRIVTQTAITACPLRSRGKVRDIYDVDAETLLIVTTDRMSAYDVIMGEAIPYKGVILNQITLFWMEKFRDIIPNHLVESDVNRFPSILAPWADELEGRAVLVRKAKPLPVECIVRGYLSGSGWKDYQATGKLCGYDLPAGLRESDKLEPALFTPSTKAELGEHDENISVARAAALLGSEVAQQAQDVSLRIYEAGRAYAAGRGIIVADTKFEFGFIDGKLHIIDEVLTPDSSRFWPADKYVPGQGQPSFDKQYLRDWLKSQPWNMQPPAPALPQEIIDNTAARYREAYEILTGKRLTV